MSHLLYPTVSQQLLCKDTPLLSWYSCIIIGLTKRHSQNLNPRRVAVNPNYNHKVDLWPFNPNHVTCVGHPKVIPYTKFENFGVIRFWVMLRTLNMHLLILWPWPLNPKTVPLLEYEYPKVIFCIKFEHFGIIRFWVMLWTNRQTNRLTRKSYPHRLWPKNNTS